MTALRNFKIGNIYHLIKRGVGHQEVFLDKQDYSRFSLDVEFCNNQKDINLWDILVKGRKENKETGVRSKQTLTERIEKARSKKGEPLVKLLGFVLMPTHIHFIVREIIDDGISEFMRKLGGYTSYYNNRHDRGGTLFRRYESVPVETDQQLHIVFAYVHTNPISLWEPGWKEYKV